MISLALSYSTEADVIIAYRTAGGTIGAVPTEAAPAINPGSNTVNCAGTPPTFFDKWTYRPTDQLPNLYKGTVDMGDVVAVQAPSQAKGWTRLDVIQRELEKHEFVGAHAAEWYRRPENLAAFLAICPSGYLVFLEKYRLADRSLRVVYLFVLVGRVCVDNCCAGGDSGFDAQGRFAVLGKLSA